MKRIFIISVAIAFLLSACTGLSTPAATTETPATENPTHSPPPTPSPTPMPTPTPTPVPTPTPTPTPPPSLTSGLPSLKEYQPICVMIENHPAARPHAGMSQADVVYEAQMESRSLTRFICVFNDNHPTNVGPVRSCRVYFADVAQEYKGILVHFGGAVTESANVYPKIRKAVKNGDLHLDVDGISGRYGSNSKYGIFWRSKDRRAPHNVFMNLEKVLPLFTAPIEPVSHFLFNPGATYAGEDFHTVEIKYPPKTVTVKYEYDPVARVYRRFIADKPMLDANTNEQITVRNIIVQYARTVGLGTGKGHINVKLIGEGDADVFVAGKHIRATWKRKAEKDTTKFYDESGAEIALLPGNTWVQLVPDNKSVPVNFAN